MTPAFDLFDYAARYPASPGFKESTTSRAAAESMAPTAHLLRTRCLAALREGGDGTADEIAARLDCSILAIRPRVSELQHDGAIVDTGERRANASGRSAKVWRAFR